MLAIYVHTVLLHKLAALEAHFRLRHVLSNTLARVITYWEKCTTSDGQALCTLPGGWSSGSAEAAGSLRLHAVVTLVFGTKVWLLECTHNSSTWYRWLRRLSLRCLGSRSCTKIEDLEEVLVGELLRLGLQSLPLLLLIFQSLCDSLPLNSQALLFLL